MATIWNAWYWHLAGASFLAITGAFAASLDCARAQITPDGTLGAESSVVTPNADSLPVDVISGGATRGANLFHSFEQFSVLTGRTAYFNNTPDIQNIISRVTGSSISNIDGSLGANSANLFLLNPNGIIFGPNASLNVGGSFVATTANAIRFGNQGFFSASVTDVPRLLTVSPDAFFFNQIANKPIKNNSTAPAGLSPALVPNRNVRGLRVPDGRSLLLVGGDVTLDAGRLNAFGGRVELGGLAGIGTVGLQVDGNNLRLSYPALVQRANVSLINRGFVEVTAGDGGSIGINAHNLDVLDGSEISAGIGEGLGSVGSQAGDITLDATGVIRISGRSRIINDVEDKATGNAGDINIKAGSLLMTGSPRPNDKASERPNKLSADTFAQGNAGDISVQVNDSVSLTYSGITASVLVDQEDVATFTGKGGNISVQTNGGVFLLNSIISNGTFAGGTGNIIVRANDSISLADSRLTSNTYAEGGAGNISVRANDSVSFTNSFASTNTGDRQRFSQISANGGDIEIQARSVSVTNGSGLSSKTSSRGNAGTIQVNATDQVEISNSSSLLTNTEEGASGRAGNITVNANVLEVTNGGQILTTASSGQGGDIKLKAQNLLLLRNQSQISTSSGTAGAGGNGGNITIDDTRFIVAFPSENSDITANANRGRGGVIKITATEGVYGLERRSVLTRLSDITAFSKQNPELNGEVEINTPDVDPSRGLAELPGEPVKVEVTEGCQAGGKQASIEFFNTGRGGLAPNPYEPLSSSKIWEDVPLSTQKTDNSAGAASASASPVTPPDKIVEAQGWLINEKGEVTLVAEVPATHSQGRCRLR